jgi:hypothetical protein
LEFDFPDPQYPYSSLRGNFSPISCGSGEPYPVCVHWMIDIGRSGGSAFYNDTESDFRNF